ncbi:MAG: hypothetical protein ACPL07_01315 [Candidatus Bathyarchaeia archaeon]
MTDKLVKLITKNQIEGIKRAYDTYASRATSLNILLTNLGFTVKDLPDGWLATKRFSDCSTISGATGECVVMVRSLRTDEIFDNTVYLTISQLSGKDPNDVVGVVSFRLMSPRDFYDVKIYGEI